MKGRPLIAPLDRRDFIAGAAAGIAVIGGGGRPAFAENERSAGFKDALRDVLGGAEPDAGSGKLTLELPEIAENGNGVPFTLAVDSPMTEADHVNAVFLLSTANPQASVATYRFSLASGKVRVTGRMRLAKTQDVVAVAQLSNGTLLIAERNVKVTIGGCGN